MNDLAIGSTVNESVAPNNTKKSENKVPVTLENKSAGQVLDDNKLKNTTTNTINIENNELAKFDANIVAYPNPVKNKLYVRFKDATAPAKDIKLFDANGRDYKLNEPKLANQTIEIDLSGIKGGLYFIQLKLEEEIRIIRFVKQ